MDAAQPGTRFRVRAVAETGSTNADVSAAAAAGEPEGLVIVADHQTAGRGRLGRRWVAPPGSALLASILLRPRPMAAHLAVAAVACAAAAFTGAGVKWPNDLLAADGRKLAGILAESSSAGNVPSITVGLGLNLITPPDFPMDLRRTATSLAEMGGRVLSRDEVLAGVLDELEPRYARLCSEGPDALLAEYRERCVTVGQRVRIDVPGESWEGIAVGVDDGCALAVERPGVGTVTVTVGDVIHVRPA